jgi:hypothetical protein
MRDFRAFLAAAFSTTHASAEAGFFRRHRAASRRPGQSKNSTPCYVVRDHSGQQLACVYFEDEPRGDRRPSCSPARGAAHRGQRCQAAGDATI